MKIWPLGWEDPPEEEMAVHSNNLAWEIPQTEEPVGYSPWGCLKNQTWLSDWAPMHTSHEFKVYSMMI